MIDAWLAALERRHLADFTPGEVARALRALSSTYVERRARLARRSAFDTAGKRAAYALYYSPLHFLTVAMIVDALGLAARPVRHLVDLGCGTGASGAAWASRFAPPPAVTGIDAHPWAIAEAAFTYRTFGLDHDTRRADLARVRLPRQAEAIVVGWAVNELDDEARASLESTLLDAAARGVQLLIVEPIATRVSPWWDAWVAAFSAHGGRAEEWRFAADVPDLPRRLARAAGLGQQEITARSLYVP